MNQLSLENELWIELSVDYVLQGLRFYPLSILIWKQINVCYKIVFMGNRKYLEKTNCPAVATI